MNLHFLLLQSPKSLIKKTLWIIPFVCCIFGYNLMKWYMPTTHITVPSVIGKNLVETIDLLSSHNLTVKIIDKKEDATTQEPKILQQTPAAGTHVKPHQTIHLIITQPPRQCTMPNLTNISLDRALTMLSSYKNQYKKICIPILSTRILPLETCIAQLPEAAEPLENNYVLYTTTPEEYYIVPNFIERSFFEAENILKKNNLTYKTYEEGRKPHHSLLETATIIEQQPVHGTLFSLKNPPIFHLNIKY